VTFSVSDPSGETVHPARSRADGRTGGEKLARLLKRQVAREENDPAFSERLYYRIGEVSRITGVKPHVLRYWESEFKAIKPYKAGSLQRLYRKQDLDLILKIKKLLYEDGFTISGAKKKIRDMEKVRKGQLKLRLVEKKPEVKDRDWVAAIYEELKGIRKLLE
jgi:DNA-binding transcriptional MerR regulator